MKYKLCSNVNVVSWSQIKLILPEQQIKITKNQLYNQQTMLRIIVLQHDLTEQQPKKLTQVFVRNFSYSYPSEKVWGSSISEPNDIKKLQP